MLGASIEQTHTRWWMGKTNSIFAWYLANADWWRAVRSGEWDAYYARQYGDRLANSTAAD